MTKDLLEEINDAVDKRQSWADKQRTFYAMRNGGLRRVAKPYPNAPDLHYPLGDTMIEKLKPAYIQQLYGAETITSFVAKKAQDDDVTAGVGYWFDYQLKQRSNFERTMFVSIDQMLEGSFVPIKTYWNADTKRLCFNQRDPLHVIVPPGTEEINENGGADWLTDVLHMSVAEYKANPKFKQDEDFIKSIKGRGSDDSEAQNKRQSTDLKEGINCSANENEIVLWEVYNRDRKGHKITVETISPLLAHGENEVRPSYTLPYNKGCFASGEHFPFGRIRAEIKGKGYYSSRGIIEINAAFEGSLTTNWNRIHEWMDFATRPMFENSGASPIPQAKNFTAEPGKILPPGLKLGVTPQAPSSLREDMEMIRAIAEDRTQVPNLGASEHLSGSPSVSGGVTATQINAIVGQSGQGSDMRARTFRLDLAELLNMAWSLCQQYAGDSLQYLVDKEIRTLDQTAIHDEYDIVPNGSADSWNKGQMVAKRMAYYQTFQENPFIDKAELTKWLLEADDPRAVKRLFKDPQIQAQDQAEQQAIECLLIEAGFPPQVHESDDDKMHVDVLAAFAQDKINKVEMTPEMAGMCQQHGIEHMGQLKAKDDPALKQIEAKLRPLAEALAFISQQPGPPPKNVVGMPSQTNLQPQAGQTPPQTQDISTASPVVAAPLSPTEPTMAQATI